MTIPDVVVVVAGGVDVGVGDPLVVVLVKLMEDVELHDVASAFTQYL